MSSKNCTFGSMTQMSAPWMSRIWPVVCSIRPQKIDACCAIKSDANAMPRMMPRYLPRLPVSILSAIQFIAFLLGISTAECAKNAKEGKSFVTC